ncbi:MAG: GHKL domain-containing protein, partial [Lachnospiraceae bacterium]|nr:GHKL domain-containing protein [Lachnospiraceae bacterium]
GYGLENARKTIKKYKGSYDFQQNNNTFDVAVRIPIR